MVRTLAGTLLRCEERGQEAEEFAAILALGRRDAAGPCLPPRGLFLWKIDYYREQGRRFEAGGDGPVEQGTGVTS
jgi:tRNA pseudouridine38-40 synthase